jgi:hypothetical protein
MGSRAFVPYQVAYSRAWAGREHRNAGAAVRATAGTPTVQNTLADTDYAAFTTAYTSKQIALQKTLLRLIADNCNVSLDEIGKLERSGVSR